MMSTSIKKNFTWNAILTISGYIFPLLTFPYVTRVLGADGFGNYQFAENVIQYFTILSMLGVSTVGIREIAKAKGDRESMSRAFSSILTLNLLTTLIAIVLLLVLSFIIQSFASHSRLLYIGIARLLFNALLVEWFFRGLENFSYITIRAVAVRCVYVAAVFFFVRNRDDYTIYFVLTSLISIVNAIINILYSKRFVDFSFKSVTFRPYLVPIMTLGLYSVLTAVYTSLNPIYLGSVGGDSQIGYYSVATKTQHIVLSLYTAFTGVMLPRLSSLLAENKEKEFNKLIEKSFSVLFCFALPLIYFVFIFAPEIINILAGDDFEVSITCLRIVSPLIFVIGYEQILVIQVLMPMGKDKAILINSIIGSLVCIVLNLLLVKSFLAVGSSWVWLASELSVFIAAQLFVGKYTSSKFPVRKFLKYLISGLPAIVILYCVSSLDIHRIVALIIALVLMCCYFYVIYVYVLKEPLIRQMLDTAKKRVHHV